MTTFPGSPPTVRAALMSVDILSLRPVQAVAFQFNPHTLTRSFELKAGTTGAEAGQIRSAPIETIKLELELDGTDGLLDADALGIAPQIAALEEMASRSSAVIVADLVLSSLGVIEIVPPITRLTVLSWGMRVLPVVITELSVTEEAFDPELNPLRARVALGLRVLNWDDVGPTHPAFGVAMAHKVSNEVLAALAATGGAK